MMASPQGRGFLAHGSLPLNGIQSALRFFGASRSQVTHRARYVFVPRIRLGCTSAICSRTAEARSRDRRFQLGDPGPARTLGECTRP
jgi:hypothetical protein